VLGEREVAAAAAAAAGLLRTGARRGGDPQQSGALRSDRSMDGWMDGCTVSVCWEAGARLSHLSGGDVPAGVAAGLAARPVRG
jgi:hypothetical protein